HRLAVEAGYLETVLGEYLGNPLFCEISPPVTLPLNSPVLQRKEGYRDVLRVWLMFNLAAQLPWDGGDTVYDAGKRDVATLYEYWVFFQLLDIVREKFSIAQPELNSLIGQTGDKVGLKLRQGSHVALQGVYEHPTRKLQVELSYNRTFSGKQNYPDGGSWTRSLRPDYTLTIWPAGIKQEDAEEQELIVHVHFDAKYKIEHVEENWKVTSEKAEEEKEL